MESAQDTFKQHILDRTTLAVAALKTLEVMRRENHGKKLQIQI